MKTEEALALADDLGIVVEEWQIPFLAAYLEGAVVVLRVTRKGPRWEVQS